MGFSTKMLEVTFTNMRKAKEFKLLQTEGIKMSALGLFFLFPKDSYIYVYID
jgi:hypothetical protein